VTRRDPDASRNGADGGTGHGDSPGCEWGEQSVGWALYALEPQEQHATARHLSDCQPCRELVARTHDTMTQWASTIPPLIPSPRLGEILRARVATTPQRHRLPPNTPEPDTSDLQGSQAPRVSRPGSTSRHRSRRRRHTPGVAGWALRRRFPIVLAAAGLVTVIGMAVGALGVNDAWGGHPDRGSVQALAGGLPTLLEQASRTGAAHAVLRNGSGVPLGAVVVTPAGLRTLTSTVLPAPIRGVYVLWGTGAQPPIPLAILTSPVPGSSEQLIPFRPHFAAFTGYAMSLEPGPTPPATPSTILASGQLTE